MPGLSLSPISSPFTDGGQSSAAGGNHSSVQGKGTAGPVQWERSEPPWCHRSSVLVASVPPRSTFGSPLCSRASPPPQVRVTVSSGSGERERVGGLTQHQTPSQGPCREAMEEESPSSAPAIVLTEVGPAWTEPASPHPQQWPLTAEDPAGQ